MRKDDKCYRDREAQGITNQRSEDEKDVEGEAGAGGGEEDGYRVNFNDGGGHGDCDEELDGDDRIDLTDERPSELGALHHHRVQRRLSRLQIILLVPHLPDQNQSEMNLRIFSREINKCD